MKRLPPGHGGASRRSTPAPVWLFDLDNTLHNASASAFPGIHLGMMDFMREILAMSQEQADHLRVTYWKRYGATLLGLVRHHGVRGPEFLKHAHTLPGLEQRVQGHRADLAALRRLPGRVCVLTNAPEAYARRVLTALGLLPHLRHVLAIEHMRNFGHWRPKPDRRMLRCLVARLRVPAQRCVLVEDTPTHLKAARHVGLRTVWLRRWVPEPQAGQRRAHLGRAYVDHVLPGLQAMHRHIRWPG